MTAIIIDMNKRDPLTSLERVSLALQYKQPDRVPVAPLVCGASHRVLGITYDRWSQDADLAVQSLLDAQELIGFDAWLTLVDLSVEAYDFGQEVIFPRASTAYPNTDNPRIKTVEDYYRLEKVDPLKTKRMRHVIDIVAGLSRAKGQEIAINGFVYGPLGVLSQIRGHERLFKDLIRQPDAVLHAVELITGVLEIYAREQVRAVRTPWCWTRSTHCAASSARRHGRSSRVRSRSGSRTPCATRADSWWSTTAAAGFTSMP